MREEGNQATDAPSTNRNKEQCQMLVTKMEQRGLFFQKYLNIS